MEEIVKINNLDFLVKNFNLKDKIEIVEIYFNNNYFGKFKFENIYYDKTYHLDKVTTLDCLYDFNLINHNYYELKKILKEIYSYLNN
jgi:hypothetical protein